MTLLQKISSQLMQLEARFSWARKKQAMACRLLLNPLWGHTKAVAPKLWVQDPTVDHVLIFGGSKTDKAD